MIITEKLLQNELDRLAKRREQLVADLNGVIGAEQEAQVLMAVLKTPEPKTPEEKNP